MSAKRFPRVRGFSAVWASTPGFKHSGDHKRETSLYPFASKELWMLTTLTTCWSTWAYATVCQAHVNTIGMVLGWSDQREQRTWLRWQGKVHEGYFSGGRAAHACQLLHKEGHRRDVRIAKRHVSKAGYLLPWWRLGLPGSWCSRIWLS